jgi:hypothetical protein
MLENLTPEQMTIFNRVMKSSFYYPIAASRTEPKTNYPTDVIAPAAVTSFYTEYFKKLDEMYDEGSEFCESISSDNLSDFLNDVASFIQQLDSSQKSFLLDDAEKFTKKERAHFEEYDVTLEEHHSFFHTTKMVSQLLRYRAAYGWMGYFQDAA